jgi:hypothetical protein
MAAVQQQTDINGHPYILDGRVVSKQMTVSQDAGRGSADMVKGTVMAYNPTTEEWEPFSNAAATDGTAHPKGILWTTLAAADIVAGDIDNVPILVGGSNAILNESLVTFENSLTKDTIVNIPANLNKAAWQLLADIGFQIRATQEGTSFEAA